jgi:hypothetical protein
VAALSLTELQSLRDELVRALARGERRVRDANGEEVEYASKAEQSRALAHIESRIAALQSAGPNVIRFQTSKGT